ncbi:MAG: DUF1549 domain-containing protein, partial [Verrucomicrobiota bacterium]
MSFPLCLGLMGLIGTASPTQAEEGTTIYDRKGRGLEVMSPQVVGTDVVFFRKDDGKRFSLPLANLAEKTVDQLTGQSSNGVNFHFQIRPILETSCVGCHGAERQKGGLRLDTREGALKGGNEGPAYIEGDASVSWLYEMVSLPPGDDQRMPAKGDPLTEEQQALIKRWIDGGAPWSGGPLQEKKVGLEALAHAVPGLPTKVALMENPQLMPRTSAQIDAYLRALLEKEGLPVGKAASDEVFVRRAYLDITGRIPTLDEYESFVASAERDKRDHLVTQLLDSDGFVSHTHNQWQDALRVKNTHRKIDMTSYKLWLRKAIQENMPYDQFVREQLVTSGHIENPEAAAVGFIM